MIAPEIGIKRRGELVGHLADARVTVVTSVQCEEITAKGVVIKPKDGEKQVIEADTVILAGEVKPNVELGQAMEGKVPELYLAGDCTGLGLIKKATADAMNIACKI
jgi:2,4-dienoyl-CoA reductase (NADPH2)